MELNWKRIALDVLIIIVLSSIAGVLGVMLAMYVPGGQISALAFILLIPILFNVLGFANISLRANNLWPHLLVVAIIAWLIANVIPGMISAYRFPEAELIEGIVMWIKSLGWMLVSMVLGRMVGAYIQKRRIPKL